MHLVVTTSHSNKLLKIVALTCRSRKLQMQTLLITIYQMRDDVCSGSKIGKNMLIWQQMIECLLFLFFKQSNHMLTRMHSIFELVCITHLSSGNATYLGPIWPGFHVPLVARVPREIPGQSSPALCCQT